MTDNGAWDPTLFRGAAEYYLQGRQPYAPGLADTLKDLFSLDPATSRLLDVGCGPGSVCVPIAHLYQSGVGIDPDPGMITDARNFAARQNQPNLEFLELPAERLPAGLGRFDTITFGSSFHWMDRERVATTVKSMLTAAGAVVQVDTSREPRPTPSLPHPLPPRPQIKDLVTRYLGPERRAGKIIGFESPADENLIWPRAGFTGPQTVVIPDGRILERTIDDVIAGTLSMSSSTPYLFGERLEDFRRDLADLLAAASPDGRFSVPLPDTELRIWRQ
ncbi:MAG TPA: class I SAM-dependent methyltransferase [Mycobacteriales bacterium]|nr:class I SAM-dependent methyltransferase [Mycobacteriales bacterium]